MRKRVESFRTLKAVSHVKFEVDICLQYDIYIPATMETPHGGFYVNDESLQFEMLDGEKDEQNDDKEIDDLSQDELEEKRKKKRRRKVWFS